MLLPTKGKDKTERKNTIFTPSSSATPKLFLLTKGCLVGKRFIFI